MVSENSLVSKYLSSKNQKERKQLLVLLKAQGIEPASPPPSDLSSEFHERWALLTEPRRQEITNEWARLDNMPRWKGATKCLSGQQQ